MTTMKRRAERRVQDKLLDEMFAPDPRERELTAAAEILTVLCILIAVWAVADWVIPDVRAWMQGSVVTVAR